MPKLNAAVAQQAAENKSDDFEALPPGVYRVRLREVEAAQSQNNNPMWKVTLDVVDDEFKNRRLWTNVTLTEKAMFKVAEFFAAFGVPTDTDTDDMLGSECKASVSQRIIPTGNRAGEMGNNVDRLLPLDENKGADIAPSGGASASTGAKKATAKKAAAAPAEAADDF